MERRKTKGMFRFGMMTVEEVEQELVQIAGGS